MGNTVREPFTGGRATDFLSDFLKFRIMICLICLICATYYVLLGKKDAILLNYFPPIKLDR